MLIYDGSNGETYGDAPFNMAAAGPPKLVAASLVAKHPRAARLAETSKGAVMWLHWLIRIDSILLAAAGGIWLWQRMWVGGAVFAALALAAAVAGRYLERRESL